MDHLEAHIPYSRLVGIAMRLGSDAVYVCPNDDHECFRNRPLEPYKDNDGRELDECANCFLQWLLMGN